MADVQLTLTLEEKNLLTTVLDAALKSALITEHRTDALTLRKELVQKEDLLTSILEKLRRAT
jgi:hypothetical protein